MPTQQEKVHVTRDLIQNGLRPAYATARSYLQDQSLTGAIEHAMMVAEDLLAHYLSSDEDERSDRRPLTAKTAPGAHSAYR